MTKLEELINELCPDGVEYFTLEDITKAVNIGINPRKFFKLNPSDATGFYVTVRELNGLQGVIQTEKTDTINDEAISIIQNRANIEIGDILFSNTGTVGKMALVIDTPRNWGVNEGIYVIKPNNKIVDSRYLYYYLASNLAYKQYSKKFTGSTLKHVTQKALMELQIPLPPLSIQSEIVHILDSFTLLTAELTTELTARQKQYAFYRDYLLNFSDEDVTKKIPDIDCSNVEYKRLGDIATAIYRGAGIKRDEVTETGIPCVRYGEIYTTYNVTFNNCVSHTDEDKIQNKKYFEHGDVLFAITGESVEEIAKSCVYLGHDKCLAGGDIVVLKHNQNPKYMAYVLSTTNAQSQKSKGKVKSKVVHSSVPAISDIIIPIPPLAEQEKIANMIERFDHLCNDISNGLPAEIEARKKQYEYYRDTLLSFDDKACSHIVKVERERANTH